MPHPLHRILLLLALALATSPALAQNTLLVPQTYPTIQAALNSSSPGDTVLVAPGIYPENLTFPHAVTLQSSAGPASTTIDGQHAGPVLTIANLGNANSAVSGFTLTHGLATSASHNAAGIALAQSGATLANLVITDNSGDGVGVFFGTVTLRNSTISTAPSTFGSGCDGGAGIAATGSSTIYDSTGASIPITVTGNTFAGNSSACSGTGITLSTDSFTTPHLVANNIIRDSALGLRLAVANGILLQQNLVFDNLQGALVLSAAATPSTDPAQTLLINNTVVNNLNLPSPNDPSPSEIHLLGTAATTAFINNILVGTTPNPVLLCEAGTPSLNETPLILDHTDLYNTSNQPSSLYSGDCFPTLANPLSSFGNASADPHFAGSTDLHLTAASPAIDSGTNSAAPTLLSDLDGNPRPLDATNRGYPILDMGAYEFTGGSDATPVALTLTASAYLTPATTITLTAQTTTPQPGTITFLQNGTSLGTAPLNPQGIATLAVPLSALGVYAFTATYTPPGPALAPTTTPVLFVDVTTSSTPAAPTTLTLSANPTTITASQTTTLALHLSSSANSTIPPGNVQLYDNGVLLASLTPDPTTGQASYLTSLAPSPSTHTLQATYSPSSSASGTTFAPGSATTTVTVTGLVPTTLTLNAAPTTPTPGQIVTLTAHLGSTTPANTPGPTPPGALSLYDGSTFLTTLQPDSSGTVTYTLPASTAPGPHTYVVRYSGTTTYSPASSSTSLTLPATLATTLVVQPSANPVTLDAPLTLVATVTTSGATPTGSIRFTDSTTTLATVPLTSGQATLATSALSLGPHHLAATFLPDPGFSPSSAALAETVRGIPTSLSATSAGNYTTGQPFSLLVTATAPLSPSGQPFPIAPSGVLTVSENSALLATVTLSPSSATTGTAPVSLTLNTPGLHTLTLAFTSPTGDFLPSQTTLAETLTNPAPITLSLSALPSSPTVGTPVTLTTQATSSQPMPGTATIIFLDGATPLATVPLAATASYTTSSLSLGTHTLSAVVHDAHGATLSTAPAIPLTVRGLTAALAFTVAPAPSALATTPVTFTAALSAPSSTHLAGGTITFFDGSSVLATLPPDSTGHAVLTTSVLTAGPHTLSATYSGDSVFAPATAASSVETILPNTTVTTLAPLPPNLTALTPILLSATVTSPTSSAPLNTRVCTPACAATAVTFLTGNTVLGTSPVDATGRASLLVLPHAGPLTVTAQFSGSPLFSPSTSSSQTLTVVPAPTTLTLTASPNPLYQNGTTTLTTTLSAAIPTTSSVTLTNPVTITSGVTTVGTANTPTATVVWAPSTVGTVTLTATYPGSPDLTPATVTATITILASDLSLSLEDTTVSLRTTHHTNTAVTLVASGAMSDTVDLSCPDAPFLVSCTFSPASTPVSADGAASGSPTTTIHLALDTDFIHDWASIRPPSRPNARPQPDARSLPLLALALPPGLLLWLTARRHSPSVRPRHPGSPAAPHRSAARASRQRSSLPNLLAGLLLLATAALSLSSCSGRQPGHTPPGTYTLTIAAHARTHNLTRTAPLTLTVLP